MLSCVVLCCLVLSCVVLCCLVFSVLCCVVLWCGMLCCVVLRCGVLCTVCCVLLWCALLCSDGDHAHALIADSEGQGGQVPLKGAPVPRRVPCRVLSCFSLLCRTVYCLVVLWRFVLCCYAMLRCLVLWRGVLCAVFCCVVLCYVRILTTYTHTLLASSEGPGGQVPL